MTGQAKDGSTSVKRSSTSKALKISVGDGQSICKERVKRVKRVKRVIDSGGRKSFTRV